MPKIFYATVLLAMIVLSVSAVGCRSTDSGNYDSSDDHAGHRH